MGVDDEIFISSVKYPLNFYDSNVSKSPSCDSSYARVCFTCGILLCDKRLRADRLGSWHPAGNAYQAALQV